MTRMEKTVGDEDRGVWLESEKQFHMQLIRLCDNQRLIGIYENLFGLMERARYFLLCTFAKLLSNQRKSTGKF